MNVNNKYMTIISLTIFITICVNFPHTFISLLPNYPTIVTEPNVNHTQKVELVTSLPISLMRGVNVITFHNHPGEYKYSTVSDYFPVMNPLGYPPYRENRYCGMFTYIKTIHGGCTFAKIDIYNGSRCNNFKTLWHEIGHYYDLCRLGHDYETRIEEAELFADDFFMYHENNLTFTKNGYNVWRSNIKIT